MPFYIKKPIVVEARRLTRENAFDIFYWINKNKTIATLDIDSNHVLLTIDTLEGKMVCRENNYIIRGIHGEFYPCEESIFLETYEQIG